MTKAARQIATAAEESSAASREAATASAEQSRGVEDLAAAIEEIATLADELKQQMPDADVARASASSTRFLTFRIEEQLYALRAEDVVGSHSRSRRWPAFPRDRRRCSASPTCAARCCPSPACANCSA